MDSQERVIGDPITLADFDRLLQIVDTNLQVGLHDENPEVTAPYRASALASAASAVYLLAGDGDMTPLMRASMMAAGSDIALAALVLADGGDRHAMSVRVAASMGRTLTLFEDAGEGTNA